MLLDVKKARYIKGYQLEVEFENGDKGIVDFADYIKKGGVFKKIKAFSRFKKYYIDRELGTICWPGAVDVSPEALHGKILKK
jgi:hypothetical protein